MDIVTLKNLIELRILASAILGAVIIMRPRRFLLWIPLLPYAGLWAYTPDRPRSTMFLNSYLEFALVAFFFIRLLATRRIDRVALWLGLLALAALPSLALSSPHELLSLILLVFLLGGAGVYRYFLDHMPEAIASRLIDRAVVMWLVLGLLIKVYLGMRLGESALVQRGGGILGSNHVAGILFLLLPLVSRQWLMIATMCFLLLTFSRGVYVALVVYGVLWMSLVSRRQVMRGAVVVGLAAALFLAVFLPHTVYGDSRLMTVGGFLVTRFRLASVGFLGGLAGDARADLLSKTWDLARRTNMLGFGLGGTYWGLRSVGVPEESAFSNMHNILATSLVEGGVVFALAVTLFLGGVLVMAYRVSKPAFVGLMTWVVYGLYSGQLYEAGGFATAGDFYTLLFLVAYVGWLRRRKEAVQAGARVEPARPRGSA